MRFVHKRAYMLRGAWAVCLCASRCCSAECAAHDVCRRYIDGAHYLSLALSNLDAAILAAEFQTRRWPLDEARKEGRSALAFSVLEDTPESHRLVAQMEASLARAAAAASDGASPGVGPVLAEEERRRCVAGAGHASQSKRSAALRFQASKLRFGYGSDMELRSSALDMSWGEALCGPRAEKSAQIAEAMSTE